MVRNDLKHAIFLNALWVMGIVLAPLFSRTSSAEDRVVFDNSVKPVAAGVASREVMSADENSASVEFMVALKLRDFAGLQKRIARGEIISDAEFDALYMPLDADFQGVRAWAIGQGLTIVNPDQNRMGLFLSGSAAQVKQALQVSLAKVSVDGVTYTSANSSPSLPANVATPVLGINGLQPHIRAKKHIRQGPGVASRASNAPPYYPSEIIKAYNGNTLSVDGTGQSIAIVIDTFPKTTDLQAFWTTTGVNQSLNNISMIQVVSGRLGAPSGEETLDVEWSSSVAPGAKVRVYASLDLASNHLDQALQAVINDIPANPSIHQLSMSYGLGELNGSVSQNQTDSQYYATLASKGVTCFASSGDDGSTDGGGSLQVENPASDPSVTAVGGTSLRLNSGGAVSSETVWSGTGGGHSAQFSRPSWQTGSGVPSGTDRLVPDVALPADPSTGCMVVLNGSSLQYGGTSWSAPTWAGFCSRINQARAAAALTPVGILGAKIYPLIGTNNLRDITNGTNATTRSGGLYSAGAGYDLCTGVGVPNLANLVPTLSASGGGGSGTPNLTSDPNTPIAAPGSVTVGGNLSVSSGVLNNGTAGAGTFTVTYRLSTSTTYDASGALIGSVSIGGLGAGATATAPFSGGCPNVAAGSYYLVGFIDSSNDVAESNENDNVFFDATPIVVSAGTSALPNLAPYTPQGWSDSIVVANSTGTTVDSTTLSTTDTLYVDFAYVNLSSTTATSASFIVQLYVDSTLVKTITQSAPLGHFYVRTQDLNIGSLSAGTHTLVLKVDPNNSVAESNESDNTYTRTITVNGVSTPPPPPPNQVPVIVSGPTYAPNSPTPGTVVSFSVAATEAGNNHLTYAWTFGDGATGNGASPTHVFAAAGSYLVTVTVSDGNAGSATGSVIVTVGSVIHTANVVRKSFGLNFRNRTDTFDIVLSSGAFAGLGDGTQVSFQIGSQTIDSGVLWRGRASGSSGRFTYNSRSRTIEYSGRNLGLLNLLAPYGVANQTIFSSVSIPLSLSVNGSVYGGTVSFRYVALAGKAGKGF